MNGSVRRVLMLRSCGFVRSYAGGGRKSKGVFPRPPEIPFQPKLANAVNLIGEVQSPLQFQSSPDGNHVWAATVVTSQQSPSSPYLQIPVIFEGDLAHTAFTHLRPNHFIHIAGHLTVDPPHFDHLTPPQVPFQIMVQTLNFVNGIPQLNHTTSANKTFPLSATESEEHSVNPSRKHVHAKKSEEIDIDKSWKDLLDNPIEWWDIRSAQNPKGAAFERKTNGELLFINTSTTPKWLKEILELMTFDLKPEPKYSISGAKKNPNASTSSWTDLLDNPTQWSDFRDKKRNGLVNPKHPDFKRKDGSDSLWLNRATTWVLPKLKGLEFDVPVAISNKANDFKGGDESWNDLVQNPSKWWDNRSDKRNHKAPDFKHKENGKALWLDNSPSWVLSKLPPVKPKQSVEIGGKQTLVS
ncbi:hypothetical protein Fmac_030359 [Flemingia macrophylla]|uniref:Uncharacterized protein n=1 Tax=Flemingia macrophylla TaxID=520843 RepID=A0ABD1LCY1_9FABA